MHVLDRHNTCNYNVHLIHGCLLTNNYYFFVVCSLIVNKIDKNNDGYVTQEELKDWIKFTQTRYIMNDVHSQWDNHKNLENGKLSWALYRKDTYGFMSGEIYLP